LLFAKKSLNETSVDFRFAASVGSPDKSSDEYVPLVLTVNNLGTVSISKYVATSDDDSDI